MRIFRASAPTPFSLSVQLALAAWIVCALIQLALYARASPYGGPFLLEWRKYFLYALYYDLMGVWLVALPFFLYRLLRPGRRARAAHGLQAALLALYIALSQLDHEVLRFLGIRLGASFLSTYARPETVSDSLFFDILADDAGGPYLPLVLLGLAPLVYLGWALRRVKRLDPAGGTRPRLWPALLIVALPIAAPLNAWNKATGKFRLRKVEPVTFAIAVDLALGLEDRRPPRDHVRLVRDRQAAWLAASADKGWRFPDSRYPYYRVPARPAEPAPGERWNLIFIQLETFRGAEMGFLGRRPSPTPFLDSLADSPGAATWTRALSPGPPSINGLFAGHCSAAPHSRRYMTGFTHAGFYCLPEALAKRGYRTEMFNAGDTDWDNGTWWIGRWYHRLWRYPEAREQDRPVFRAAARRISELGAAGPFLATIVSVTNHTPFRSREPGFDMAGGDSPRQRILNTTRYTDDVLREFVETLRGEPWFARTLLVLVGDHGFNMGEHDGRPGQQNLYRESTWVPLVIAGAHPRLPAGRHDELASMLDIAPTLADLLGIREAVPWQGHSLLAAGGPRALYLRNRSMLAADTPAWSLVTDPLDGRPRLFDARTDWAGQRRDLAVDHPRIAAALADRAREAAELNDHLLRQGRIRPPSR